MPSDLTPSKLNQVQKFTFCFGIRLMLSCPHVYLAISPFLLHFLTTALFLIKNVPGGMVNILGGHSIGHSKKKVYMNVCPIPKGLWYMGSQYFELGAQYFPSFPLYEQSQQPTDASHRFTCFRHWRITTGGKENIARQIQNTAHQISETVRNRTHVHTNIFLEWPIIWPPRILIFPPETLCIYHIGYTTRRPSFPL
jgi:hypothetical protein